MDHELVRSLVLVGVITVLVASGLFLAFGRELVGALVLGASAGGAFVLMRRMVSESTDGAGERRRV